MIANLAGMHPREATPSLSDKSIVIIGGTTGLGLSAAKAMVRAGAKLVCVGRDDDFIDTARKELGSAVTVLSGEATDPETAVHAVRTAVERHGGFHGLYHVAGGSGRRWGDGPLDEIDDEGWGKTLELNLNSVFYSNRAAVRQFLEQRSGGSILNLGSVLATSPSPEFFSTHAYAAAKSAIIGLTRACAARYAKDNIRFNVLAPALVETPMSRRAVADDTIRGFVESKQLLDGGRVGRVDDLDAAAVYFLGDGSRFTTGQVLRVDGGWSVTDGRIPG